MSDYAVPTPHRQGRPVAGALVIVAGLLGCFVVAGVCFVMALPGMPLPGTGYDMTTPATVAIDEPGEHAIYVRGDTVTVSNTDCTVTTTQGTPVTVRQPADKVRTSWSGAPWVWVGTFRADAGSYLVSCSSTAPSEELGVAKAPSIARFMGWAIGGVAGAFLVFAAGIGVGLYLILKRGGPRREAARRTA